MNAAPSSLAGRILASRATAWFVVLLGAVLRLRRYLLDRGVKHDEAQLAMNVMSRSIIQLLRPLDLGDQAAPVGFLILQKLALFFGHGVWAIRAVPFIASLVALPLIYELARRLFNPIAALFAVAILALSYPAIYYGAEGKQYSTDLLWTLVILWLALRPMNLTRLILLTVAGAILIWFSHPSLFVLLGCFGAIAIDAIFAADYRTLAGSAIGSSVSIASFAANYLLISRYYAASDYLRNYWRDFDAFAPLPTSFHSIMWYAAVLAHACAYPVGLSKGEGHAFAVAWVAQIALIIGLVLMCRDNRRVALAILLTLIAAIGASALQKYPFNGRLVMFAVPLLILPIASIVGSSKKRAEIFAAIVLVLVLMTYPAYLSAKYFRHPFIEYDLQPAMRFLHAHAEPGDVVYLHFGSAVLGNFYLHRGDCDAPGAKFLFGELSDDSAGVETKLSQALQQSGGKHFWILTSMARDRAKPILDTLQENHAVLNRYAYDGGEAYEFSAK